MACNCQPYYLPNKKKVEKCLCTPNFSDLCDNGPEPCSGSFSLNVSTKVIADLCGDDYTYSIRSHSPELSNVAITQAGVVTADVDAEPLDELFIVYRVTCDDDTSKRSDGVISICVKDTCKGVECEDGECCDPCTSLCTDVDCPDEVVGDFDIIVS